MKACKGWWLCLINKIISILLIMSLLLLPGCSDNSKPNEQSGPSFKAVDFGFTHIVALLDNGDVIAWGDNSYG